MELQVIGQIYDENIANRLGLYKDSVTIMIYTGSRGFGYQICDGYLKIMVKAVNKYQIDISDRQLACVPIAS